LKKQNLINSKTVFISTLIVAPVLTLLVYLSGLNAHRSLYLNSLLSTTILSLVFLVFISIGLYKGWKLKKTMGNFLNKFDQWKKPSSSTTDTTFFELPTIEGEGIEGCIFSLLVWLILAVFGALIFWLVGAVIWATILLVAGMLYWIIFRAFRLIFKNSRSCQGNFIKSVMTALLYTILYNCWLYAIIFGAHYLHHQ
jgi:hypothetical protein